MPALIGFSVAVVILAVAGLLRAVSEYGHAGFVAWLKVLFGPAAIVIAAIVFVPGLYRGQGTGLRALFPSDRALRILLIAVLAVTAVWLALSGALGVGWLVAK